MISKADCDRCATPGTRDAGIYKEDGERAEGERGAGDGRRCGGHVKLRFFPRAADSGHVQVRGEERGVCGTFFQETVLLPRWDQRPEKATPEARR
ncbi:unnamed protein product [Sphagnum jensenii]|jgi:hypothetical protein|uniref:Uncharacterized protein n=1 Tax=Sphagnum jensenii TaxID=128206 RepID=A0ABP0W5Q4_9BRYO